MANHQPGQQHAAHSQPAPPPPEAAKRRRPRLKKVVLALVVLAAAVVVGGYVLYDRVIKSNDDADLSTVKGTGAAPFTMQYPKGWAALSEEELQTLPGKPLAVIREDGGKGFVVVRGQGPAPKNLMTFADKLTREFRRRIPDFQKQSVRVVKVRAGTALLYTYIRKRTGTVHTVVIVPAGNHSFTVNTISRGGEEGVAQQVGAMVVSFDT